MGSVYRFEIIAIVCILCTNVIEELNPSRATALPAPVP